ncbi:hypothetical protein [Pararhizobium sp. O133]|uniref:hypothetical protein n=1 Tax=Pararhizobium sp. O133 TaxID=3449278 RepID=UPI003F68542D
MTLDRLSLVEKDSQSHARTLTALTERMAEYEKDAAVKEVKDEYLQERLTRIEKIGMWILTTFGATFIAVLANFVFKGGFFIAK